MDSGKKPKISNTEWGLIIGALLTIDIIQIVLEWLVIGLIINPFIDIFVGMSLALYLQLRGQSMANPKRLIGVIGAFLGEQVPGVDAVGLPLWTLDGVFNFIIARGEEKIKQIPGIKLASKVVSISQGKKPQSTTDNQNTDQKAA